MPGYIEPKEYKKRRTTSNHGTWPKHAGIADCLVPAAGKVKEWRSRSDGRDRKDGGKDEHCDETEEALKGYSKERSNSITAHDILFDYQLRRAAAQKGMLF